MHVYHPNALTSVGFKRDSFIQRTVMRYGIYMDCICVRLHLLFFFVENYLRREKEILHWPEGFIFHSICLTCMACSREMHISFSVGLSSWHEGHHFNIYVYRTMHTNIYMKHTRRTQRKFNTKRALNYLLKPQLQKYKWNRYQTIWNTLNTV